jgi:putative multiple sugar transport system substrate-binding protein
MKKNLLVLTGLIIALTMILSACAPAAPAASSGGEKPLVGIVLPTKDEPRWIQDETRFKDAIEKAGYNAEILFSQGSSATEKANVEALIAKGAKVIILTPQDGTAAAAAAEEARKAGVKLISYDRLIRDTDAVDYYVTFDSNAVGAKQAQYLVDNATGKGNPLYLYAGAASDNNAFLFFEGAWEVLQPKIADGTFVIKNSSEAVGLQDKPTLTRDEEAKIIGQITTNWDFAVAKTLAEANLTNATKADKGTVYLLAPNDGTARSIADTFAADKDVTKYYVTGQDAEKASVQYIIDGKQSMTVLKDVRTLVDDAIKAAFAFLNGQTPEATTTYNNGKFDVPAKPSEVVTVTKDNVQQAVIDSGYYPASDFTGLGAAAPAAPAAKTPVEVFSWWTTGGEANGLQKLIDQFNAAHPDAEVINAAVAGGAGSNAKAVLKTRMLGGDPPDSFQVHMGHELLDTWVKTGYMEALDDVYKQYGFNDAFAPGVLAIVSDQGHPYSVPVNIHRANVLWFNKDVFAKNGLTAEDVATFEGFKAAAEKLKAAGITPLALGDNGAWAATNLFETVLIGTLGAEKYKGLWDCTTDWSGPEVKKAIENYKMMLGYINSDHTALSWDQANQLVIDGKAAMTIMGDWANGDYTAKNFTGYGWALAPGNKGIFDALSDSFGLPKNTKNPALMKEFLGVLGSKQGQEDFNILKGSICARTDCDYSKFNPYLQSSAKDWTKDAIVPSLAHGAAASEGWLTSINDLMPVFVANGDVTAFQAGLVQAGKDAGVCK